ncbi:MAG TPA: hypothetical protein PLW65_05520 [Pseudomonadota bacterium]|nr:hypothetical protein [Pseudomonadota bacterium]
MLNPPPGPAAPAPKPSEVVAGRYRIVRVLCPSGADSPFATYETTTVGATPRLPSSGAEAVRQAVTLRLLTAPASGPGPYSLRDEDRAHLAKQAVLLMRVQHPAVAQTYELGPYGERCVLLAREPAEREGQTLRDLLAARGGPLPEAEAVKLCAQIGEALEAAHQQGACHLNLTPSCVPVYPDGPGLRVKVADFGLLPPSWAAQLGEPGYLAPEQLGGPSGATDGQLCDRRTDQFALAVILYEMLAGQPAFIAAANEDRQIVLGRVSNEDPLPLSQSRPVEQALARALSRSRGVRFPSVRDFMRALGADVSRWPASLPYIKAAGPPPADRSPRLLLPMAAGAVFALLGLGAVVALRQLTEHRGRPPTAERRPSTSGQATGATNEEGPRPPAVGPPAPLLPVLTDGGTDDAAGPAEDLAAGSEPLDLQPAEDQSSDDLAPLGPRRPGIPGLRPPTSPPPGAVGGSTGPLKLAFSGPESEALTETQRSELTSCVKMISPRLPFTILLQNINGTLYVDPNHTSPELSTSQDFRDCLKQRVKGKIVPKVLNITKMSKGKAAP